MEKKKQKNKEINPLEDNFIGFENIAPSLTHMAIVGLLNQDKIKYVISQNIDGLHIKSGIPKEKLSGYLVISHQKNCMEILHKV
jgi:NAD+-dependent protein deacetylase sirtuin 6